MWSLLRTAGKLAGEASRPMTTARTACVVAKLSKKEQAAWDRAWAVHAERYAKEIAALKAKAAEPGPVPAQHSPTQLRQLAFGLLQFELRIDTRGDAAARDGDNVLALRGGSLGDVRQGVFAIQLDIGLSDGRAEHQLRILDVQYRGMS